MATLTELNALIKEARAANHDLLIGKGVASARDQNGEEVRYTQADRTALAAYIDSLQRQIDALNGIPCVSSNIGPMRVFF